MNILTEQVAIKYSKTAWKNYRITVSTNHKFINFHLKYYKNVYIGAEAENLGEENFQLQKTRMKVLNVN